MIMKEQNAVLFEPVPLPEEYPFRLPERTKEIFIWVTDTVKLNGLHYEGPEKKELILYFQGNAKNLQNWLDNHVMALDWGCHVLVTDYRGFGKSNGEPCGQDQMYGDAEKIYEYAITLGYKPENIILYGYSMGTGLASHLAIARGAKCLILESPYSSLAEMPWVADKAPSYPFETKLHAKNISIPTLLIHGNKDEVITVDHSQRIFDNVKTHKKELVIIQDGGHGDLRIRPEYKKIITDFLDKY
jgi:pimeloyl-ACP methyl ester carboxylesterase